MSTRTLMLAVPYYAYEPRSIIIGIRPAPVWDKRHPERLLERMHADMPGWATLALATQEPVRFCRRNVVRVVTSMPGHPTEEAPISLWRP